MNLVEHTALSPWYPWYQHCVSVCKRTDAEDSFSELGGSLFTSMNVSPHNLHKWFKNIFIFKLCDKVKHIYLIFENVLY